jgi:hypothetical protein
MTQDDKPKAAVCPIHKAPLNWSCPRCLGEKSVRARAEARKRAKRETGTSLKVRPIGWPWWTTDGRFPPSGHSGRMEAGLLRMSGEPA